ncbi:MAG: DNA polymerase III subunit delta [Thermoleophilaceae bacterium]
MAELKPVYLICGEDDAKIDAWRARLRKRAEAENGPGALETFDGRENAPDDVAAAMSMLTFGTGTRYLLVDGADAWKAGELEPLERQLADPPPDTVLVLLARGKGAPKRLEKAVEKAGGEQRSYGAPKPWELPSWVVERAREEGLRLDKDAAKVLIGSVGQSQQRLSREVERLAIAAHPAGHLSAEEVQELSAGDAGRGAYDLADSVVAGDLRATFAIAERLVQRDERPSRLMYTVVRRLREVHRAAALLDAGMPEQKVGEALGGPPWAAKKVVAAARGADPDALERALCALAVLEVELRGGGAGFDEDTAFSLALAQAAG